MLSVSHKITIGSATYTSGDRTRLVELKTHASLEIPVNSCRLVLSAPEGLAISPEDPVSVELGYEDDLKLVFTGSLSSVDWSINSVSIQAAGSFQHFLTARFNLLYEKSKAGEIVTDVIDRLGLTSAKVESGIEFPVYVLGENQTAYEQLYTLAQQCGFDFYANPADEVIFAQYRPLTTHEFQYGVNILALTLEQPMVSLTGVEVYGESPSSYGQGTDAYTWLTKQEVQGSAGNSSRLVKRFTDPTVRTLETATQVAEALLSNHVQKRQGKMRVLGAPIAQLGDAIRVSGMPISQQNNTLRIRDIEHFLSVKKGFYTDIYWEET